MTVKKPTFNRSKKTAKQTINLKSVFGVDFAGKPELRDAIGQAIIDKQRERTNKNLKYSPGPGRPGKLKPDYSPSYVKSLEFRAAGKKKGDVNMELTGDMLGFWDLIDDGKNSKNTITQGWDDSTENAKAFRHNTGDKKMPKRPFFGITDSELKEIGESKKFKNRLKKMKEEQE